MALPLAYTLGHLRARWRAALVAVLGIAGSVSVFVAVLALAHGFAAALETAGSPRNALVRRTGATSELDSALRLEQVRVVEDAPEVARDERGALVSAEVVVVAALARRDTGLDGNVQVRGVTPRALEVREGLRLAEGRMLRAGLDEIVVGRQAERAYVGLEPGSQLQLGGRTWTVVGVLESGGSAYESELWADGDLLAAAYQRPRGWYQTVVARLRSPEALPALRERLLADPRLDVQVERESDYYAQASEMMTRLILGLGTLVAGIMGLGAVFAALNTLYSAVAERTREIGTLRALGFGGGAVVAALVGEGLLLALAGGLVGCLAAWPLDGLTTATMNFQTFSQLGFAFRVTPRLLLGGLAFAFVMGLAGALPPALRAARLPVATALRES